MSFQTTNFYHDVCMNCRLQNLPFTIASLPLLKAVWLSENQSQAMPNFNVDYVFNEPILTCYLLPQIGAEPLNPRKTLFKIYVLFIVKFAFVCLLNYFGGVYESFCYIYIWQYMQLNAIYIYMLW